MIRLLYDRGLKAEPAGAASVAAILSGKLSEAELAGKRVLAVVTGGNVTPDELSHIFRQEEEEEG